DLVFIKTSNTGTGTVEVHVASGTSNYQTRIFETGTTFAPESDGTWLMSDYDRDGIPDLVFIKTSNTATHKVEVHVATASGSDTVGSVVLRNETQGKSTAFLFSAPSGTHLVGNSAEWIVERPQIDNKLSNLANYSAVTFRGADAVATGGRAVQANRGNN